MCRSNLSIIKQCTNKSTVKMKQALFNGYRISDLQDEKLWKAVS